MLRTLLDHKRAKARYRLHCELDGWASWAALLSALAYNPLQVLAWPWRLARFWWERRMAHEDRARREEALRRLSAKQGEAKAADLVRTIALYLPQYHVIPENSEWWGPGFTEWTNVRKAVPLFKGHEQPHVPHPDVGYYDLVDVSVMRRQAEMAARHGVSGFCFYYYYFKDGKRLLEKPLENWLAAQDIDFPFCYAWANENWTRAWNGSDREVIMRQDYDRANIMNMMKGMLKAFHDRRYIKVGAGRTPVLLVYRAEIIPNIRAIADEWRQMAVAAGFDGLYLISMQHFERVPPAELGFDAAVEFASFHGTGRPIDRASPTGADVGFADGMPQLFKYTGCQRQVDEQTCRDYPRYKMCCPGWDNTPRKGARGYAVVGSTPARFADEYRSCIRQTLADERLRKEGLVFVNAWNEWGEGAHLEPDVRHGYAYLEAVREVSSQTVKDLCEC